jgi:hypothetical protein
MSTEAALTLDTPVVACADVVRGRVVWPSEATPTTVVVELRVHLDSASPADLSVSSQSIDIRDGAPAPFALPVPSDGPVTARGVTLAVSWSVVVAAASGDSLASAPVVVMPRGGVALWLQRHAAPPPV